MYFNSIQWSHPSTTLLSGPSNSGKTSLLSKILDNHENLFIGSKIPTILFYNHPQAIYNRWISSGLIAHMHKGIPPLEDFKSLCTYYTLGNGVSVIFDDLGSYITKNLAFFEEIFVVLSHHMKISVFLVLHNLYEKGLRKISLNSNRIILTNNSRDTSQISFFGRQCFPGTKNFLPAVYKHICAFSPYGHLVLDFSQNKDRYLRVTSNWFNKKSHIMSFIENKNNCSPDDKTSFLCYYLIPSTIYDLVTKNSQIVNNITSSPQVFYRDESTSLAPKEIHHDNDDTPPTNTDNHTQPHHALCSQTESRNCNTVVHKSGDFNDDSSVQPDYNTTPPHQQAIEPPINEGAQRISGNSVVKTSHPPFSKKRKFKKEEKITIKKYNRGTKKPRPKKSGLGDVIDFLRYKGLDSTPPGTNNEVVSTPNQEGTSPKEVKQVVLRDTPSDSNQADTKDSPHKNVLPLEDYKGLSNKKDIMSRDWVKKKKRKPRLKTPHTIIDSSDGGIPPNTPNSSESDQRQMDHNVRMRGVKRSKRDNLKREIPLKKRKINRGDKRKSEYEDTNPKKQKLYHVKNYSNNNSNYETWRL